MSLCVLFFIINSLSASAASTPYNIDSFISVAPKWISTFAAGNKTGSYSYLPGRNKPDLYGACDMVYTLYTLDSLNLTVEERQSWVTLIQNFQDPKTGWFGGNVTMHPKEHATAYAVGALKLLGAKPKFPLAFMKKFNSPEKIEKMLENIPWGMIWTGSHIGAGIPSAALNTDEIDTKLMDIYFDWLNREADPETGFWIRGDALNKKPAKDEMGGAFHFYFIYAYLKRPLPYPEKIIDATIALQHENGLWDSDVPYCIDLDGVYNLIQAYKQTDEYRKKDVEAAVEKALAAIVSRLNNADFVMKSYTDSHKLPGAVAALAEIQEFMPSLLITPKPLKSVLSFSPFI
ncbi:MAG: hypothetical protein WCX65_15565 [bacterium]